MTVDQNKQRNRKSIVRSNEKNLLKHFFTLVLLFLALMEQPADFERTATDNNNYIIS